jgi:predicted amidohydrolase
MNRIVVGLICLGAATICLAATTAWVTTLALIPHAEAALPQESDANPIKTVGRQVRVVSFSFHDQPIDEIVQLVDEEGARGADLIVLPEAWTGQEPLPIDGPLMQQIAALAKKHRTYIVNSVFRRGDGKDFNSAILIDREGRVAGTYDKAFPYWSELEKNSELEVGGDVPVFETDFGKLGIAICFDVNFPELWRRLADRHAELVVWPSAYCAGSALQAHAINHHYYIVTATWRNHSLVYDITGEQLVNSKRDGVNITRVSLDLDRRVYHENFNWTKAQQILKDLPDDVALDKYLELEQWFVLKAKRPGVNMLSIAKKYGLEDHRDYVLRSRAEMDRRRGFSLTGPTDKAEDQVSTTSMPGIRRVNVGVRPSSETPQ